MFIYDHNGTQLDFAKFPQTSQIAMARRGLTHFLGSEMASKVSAWVERETKVRAEAAKAAGTEPAPISDEERAAKRREFDAEAYKALLEGTVGVRAAGTGAPRRDPLQAEIWRQAKEEATNILKGQGMDLPKGDAKLKFGAEEFSADEFVERWLGSNDRKGYFGKPGESVRDRITKAATKRLADKAKAAEKVKGMVAAEPDKGLESLGL